MRSITDNQGRQWTATVGRESYGMQVILFVPDGGGDGGSGILKALMASDTRLDAHRELAQMSDEALLERLEAAQPWEDTTTF